MHEHHGHHAHEERRQRSRRRLWVAFTLTAGFLGVEVAGGLWSGSLALLSDAGHMLTDVASLGLALFALWAGGRAISRRYTFGLQRAEVLAALANGAGLWAIAGWIFWQAAGRFRSPVEVDGPLMLAVGAVGLGVNIAAAWVLREGAGESLNVEGAFLHVLGDAAGSVGVLAASILIMAFGWVVADPIIAVSIGALVAFSGGRLLWKVAQVLLEGTPGHINVQTVYDDIAAVEGVDGVHDLHIWTITSGYHALSAHVTICDDCVGPAVRSLQERLRGVLAERHGISHVTVQLERGDGTDCTEEAHLP
jgi:cobalt-zinc-cadmium efflux system protein